MVLSLFTDRYGVKLAIGYIVTAVFIAATGVATQSAGSTVIAAIAGLLTLGSINAAETVATLEEITLRTQQVAEGNLNQELSMSRTDEFGDLAAAINDMRGSLQTRIIEMEEARAELETARQKAEDEQQRAEGAEQEARQLVNQYESTAEQYAEVMETAANGDFRQRVDVNHDQRALETICSSFNTMLDDL